MYYADSEAAILVYDITEKESFDGMKRWYQELIERGPKTLQVAVLGNKSDLIHKEEVKEEDAREFADSIGAFFAKVSAKSGDGIEEVFLEIATLVKP